MARSTASALRLMPAASTPVPGPTHSAGRAAEKSAGERRRDGRIADAHLADAQKVGRIGDRFHSVGHGGGAFGLVERRFLGNVAGRNLQRQFEYLQPEAEGLAKLVDGGAAIAEVRHHLCGDRLREGRHILLHDPVVAGEDDGDRIVEARRVPTLPAGQPLDDLLEPAQRAQGLGQRGIAPARRVDRHLVQPRHVAHQVADVVERQGG